MEEGGVLLVGRCFGEYLFSFSKFFVVFVEVEKA